MASSFRQSPSFPRIRPEESVTRAPGQAARTSRAAVAMGLPGFPGGGGFSILNVGTPELIVIGGLAWLLLGPKELLRLSREAGVLIGNLRKIGTEAADQFREAIESEIAMDEIEQEKRAIQESMAQIRSPQRTPVSAEDTFGDLSATDGNAEATPEKTPDGGVPKNL